MMRAKRWFSKTEQHNNKCLKCLRHKEGKERARIAQVTWNLAVGRVRTPSVAWSALHPKVHSWQHKFSSEVILYSFPLHLPRMISATPLAKPCPYTPSPTLWATEVSPDPKLRDVRCSFWTQHFRKAFRATEEYLSPLPLPTVTEPLAELTSRGVNKTWIATILRGTVLEETDTTGSNAIIYCAEDTVLQFLCDQLKRSENVMLKLCSNFQLLLVKLLL